MIKKFILPIISLLITILIHLPISAQENKYIVKFSVDNNFIYSQKFGCDLSESAVNILGHISDKYKLNDNFLSRCALGYSAFMISLLNHEISGHGFRGVEFGGEIDEITINFFSGSARILFPQNIHLQKNALLSLGGNEVNNKLAQSISKNWIENNQEIDPLRSFLYIFSKGNQGFYSYFINTSLPGHDLVRYSKYMEKLYGQNAMNIRKIQSIAFLDLLDPILLSSLYSASTGYNVKIPKIQITDHLAFSPFARMILTPFAIIEKQFGLYIFTDYTTILLSFSYGTQSKGEFPIETEVYNEAVDKDKNKIKDLSLFTGFQPNESINNQSSYNINISIYKIFEINNFKIGLDTTFWNQPELFTEDSYRSKSKTGYMLVLNGLYSFNDYISLESHLGYKSKGFVPGQYIEETAIFGITLNYKL